MGTENSSGRPKARFALGAVTAAGVAVGIVGAPGAGTASARPVSITLNYTCKVSGISRTVPMEIHADVPDSVAVGKPSPEFAFDATTTASKEDTQLIHAFLRDLKSIEGTADTNVELRSQQGTFKVPVRFSINKVTIPESNRAFAVTAAGTVPSRTFHKQGTVRIAVGDLNLTLVGKQANGKPVGQVNPACKLDAHQSPVVASFAITGKGTTTGPPPSGTSGTGATTGSASAGASAVSPSHAEATAQGTMATTGQDTKGLILLAAGVLVAGGGVFLFGSRLKRRRRG
ncbi:DUF6801 domain-containing protein [Streptomyces scopuliridis]|uniref:DUF6801 domain-containing protein n=1 Tax=Streptomyces scopuliridis TaxID=452529 RepID=UPI002DDAE0FB|nr:DUF6801 domain-containing protein [Streptomyces scopuliridis]